MNENEIHPSAQIGSAVQLGRGNVIGANVSIMGDVSLGNGNHIGPGAVIQNRVVIGDENRIYGPISIGSLGEMGTKGDSMPDNGVVKIGNRNTIREFTTINFPVREMETAIGDDCYLMARTHVPHDAILGNRVVMATNSLIGGGCKVGTAAYIGLGSLVHQWINIGSGAMIGMNATVTAHVPPAVIVMGSPARITGINKIGLQRRGFSEVDINQFSERLEVALKGGGIGDKNALIEELSQFLNENERICKMRN
ncbi:MAG: UDP-N-acetylglucosamine acyltransferase [Candidatus Thalassarchaeaceae archaeon]|nr:MAG: UDP-N-acetylglucosamine acyltransferase [Euryarchaeota archaeon]|tara:strand:- start:479 stop:1237 length:759 start_codon:yes stop_codon:yes gene_type:complete